MLGAECQSQGRYYSANECEWEPLEISWLFKMWELRGNIRSACLNIRAHEESLISSRIKLVNKMLTSLFQVPVEIYCLFVSCCFALRGTKPSRLCLNLWGNSLWNAVLMIHDGTPPHESGWGELRISPLHLSSLVSFMEMCGGKVEPWMGSDGVKVTQLTCSHQAWICVN